MNISYDNPQPVPIPRVRPTKNRPIPVPPPPDPPPVLDHLHNGLWWFQETTSFSAPQIIDNESVPHEKTDPNSVLPSCPSDTSSNTDDYLQLGGESSTDNLDSPTPSRRRLSSDAGRIEFITKRTFPKSPKSSSRGSKPSSNSTTPVPRPRSTIIDKPMTIQMKNVGGSNVNLQDGQVDATAANPIGSGSMVTLIVLLLCGIVGVALIAVGAGNPDCPSEDRLGPWMLTIGLVQLAASLLHAVGLVLPLPSLPARPREIQGLKITASLLTVFGVCWSVYGSVLVFDCDGCVDSVSTSLTLSTNNSGCNQILYELAYFNIVLVFVVVGVGCGYAVWKACEHDDSPPPGKRPTRLSAQPTVSNGASNDDASSAHLEDRRTSVV